MKQDVQPLIRILMYVASGYLLSGSVDREMLAELMQSPAVIEAIAGVVVGGGALGWWRSAKKKGGPT